MKKIALLLLLPLLFVTAVQAQPPQTADLILHNGVIWTVNDKNPTAQAVAIRDGKFIVVGSNAAAMNLRGPSPRVIDLRGRLVIPGFNDNHVHFASAAQFLEFNIMRAATQEQFVARVKDVISRLPKGEW
ncbi:MAG TPA: amidohydrolase family protein, partial [Pyrinomonadaceae bacterium]|nr:amidohydrolase family protein [Pyrinomonadaceae bacterium]